jgi:phosphoserine phosphatase RsbU/P
VSAPADLEQRLSALARQLESARDEARQLREANIDLRLMVSQLEEAHDIVEEARSRERQEIELAQRIQTSILPREHSAAGLEIAAQMRPAALVGGDYYDVRPAEGGSWLAIGDVSGHGLAAGLVMLMTQSIVAAAGRIMQAAYPSEVVGVVNEVLFDNMRHRLGTDDFVTFSLFRHQRDGRLSFAGAHEEVIVLRRHAGICETFPTRGAWLGTRGDVRPFTPDTRLRLGMGDVLLLYTDGITEARNASGEQFGIERVSAAALDRLDAPAAELCNHVLDTVAHWAVGQDDDRTILVARQKE